MSKINFILNGEEKVLDVSPTKRLLDVIREELNLKGTKEGCGEGECGACSIILDNKLVNSCLIVMGSIKGKNVVTIEGLQGTKEYEIIANAFEEAGAVQCGFCTPGMVLASYALLKSVKNPTEDEIREGISGNICRCTGYNMIVDAVKLASKNGGDLW